MIRHVVCGPWLRRRWRRNAAEVCLDEILDSRFIEVADSDDRHQVRPVPVFVEFFQRLRLEILDDFGLADRNTIRIARVLEQDRKQFVRGPGAGPSSEPPFFHDDAAFLIDFLRLEGDVMRPVFEDQKRFIQPLRFIRRNLEHIDRFIETGVRVQVRAEAHAERLDK